MVGDQYRLKRDMLGCKAGTIGTVFEEYGDFVVKGGTGRQIIFSNGLYDGFSVKEQELYLEYAGHDYRAEDFIFDNVLQVEKYFRKGYWQFDDTNNGRNSSLRV